MDEDGNKVFDDFDEKMKPVPETAPFPSIVLFTRRLDEVEYQNLARKIGPFSPKYKYSNVPAMAVILTKAQIQALAKETEVKQIEYDGQVRAFLDTSTYWFGVKKARTDFGVTGNTDGLPTYSKDDIVIAVIDTGIDIGHVDLDGGKVIGWKDITNPTKTTPYDNNGHGTHVASIAAGEGEGDPAYTGVALGAALVGVKVLGAAGTGTISDVDAGIDWVISNKATYGIEVINLSLGIYPPNSDGTDSTSVLVNTAAANGIVPVVAAGNDGPAKNTIGSPAAAANAITVGMMADVGSTAHAKYGFYLHYWSSRGPTADGRIKPDISGPGVKIIAAKYKTTNKYIEKSGTSMSTPFVAGVAALMMASNPSLTPANIKSKIMSTGKDWGPTGTDIDYGAGRLDAYEAVKSAGGYTGVGILVPNHEYKTGTLSGTVAVAWWDINVVDASYPIAITMIMPDWVSFTNPDFDMELYDPGGGLIAYSNGVERQETIGIQPTVTGIYKLKVYSYTGAGSYFFDLSAGTPGPSITLTTDGSVAFSILALGSTEDTTPGGINKVQTVRVDTGPANLNIKTSLFSDGVNTWTLGTASGPNQVIWEYSPDGSTWTIFTAANVWYTLANNVAAGTTQDIYFRLTMPTSTASSNQYSGTITVMAVAP